MERQVLLDTHILVWLYGGLTNLLSSKAKTLIEKSDLCSASPMSILELDYLYECNKTVVPSSVIIEYLSAKIGLTVCSDAFDQLIFIARDLKWTRDPFDRIIAATSLLRGIPLITKDKTIRKHHTKSIWS